MTTLPDISGERRRRKQESHSAESGTTIRCRLGQSAGVADTDARVARRRLASERYRRLDGVELQEVTASRRRSDVRRQRIGRVDSLDPQNDVLDGLRIGGIQN